MKKIREPKLHAIHNFPVGSFAVRDHLRSDLEIISGLGIICGAVIRPNCLMSASTNETKIESDRRLGCSKAG